MKFKLDALHMTLLAALGLDLACAVRPVGSEAEGTDNGDGDTGDGDGDTGDGDGDTGDGDTGDGDTGDGDGDTGDGDGEPPMPFTCANPQPILQPDSGLPSGFVMCDGGFIHRAEKLDATDPVGGDDPICMMDGFGACQTGADCVDDTHGRCLDDEVFGGCYCSYGCASDADCAANQVCAPSGVVGARSTCIPAECTIDDECGDGLCGLSEYEGCCGTSFVTACAAPTAVCHLDSECPDMPCSPEHPGEPVDWQCSYQSESGANEWGCKPPGWCECDCGRPFFVDGDARVAATLARRDWCLGPARELVTAAPAMRARLAEHWTRIALFEHASIASFARFGSHLLQLGAPPTLLRETKRALADEIEHARLAFGLASAYAGAAVGPGALEVADAIEPSVDPYEILEGLIAEACVGETLAAIEAHEAACWAEDPAVASVLRRIAEDEWRHAQLGWRALAWMLAQGDERLRSFALARFEVAMKAIAAQPRGDVDLELRRHGVVDERLRAEVRKAALAKIIRPCVAALRGAGANASSRPRHSLGC